MTELKFCGMTRAGDVAMARDLGADYVGVILAGGPRHLLVDDAQKVLAGTSGSTKRVGVVAQQTVDEIVSLVRALSLDVVQLHADPDPQRVRDVRAATGVDVWAVMRINGAVLPESFVNVADAADGIVLDAKVPGGLGGTGVTLPWLDLARALRPWRDGRRIVLAGGLRPGNVSDAIAAIQPDVVDVSSGIESAPGIKDPVLMRAFRDAVQHAGANDGR